MNEETAGRILRALELIATELQVQSLSAVSSDDRRTRQQKDRDLALRHVRAYTGTEHGD